MNGDYTMDEIREIRREQQQRASDRACSRRRSGYIKTRGAGVTKSRKGTGVFADRGYLGCRGTHNGRPIYA